MVTLRELRLSDAPSLLAMLATEEVARFISPPPTTVDGFERFIAWTHRERAAGNYVCFGVVPHGMDTADRHLPDPAARAGLRNRRVGFRDRVGVLGHGRVHGRREDGRRLRVRVDRRRTASKRALRSRTVAATARFARWARMQEGILRKSFLRNGEYLDQTLWTILDEDWRRAKSVWGPRVH